MRSSAPVATSPQTAEQLGGLPPRRDGTASGTPSTKNASAEQPGDEPAAPATAPRRSRRSRRPTSAATPTSEHEGPDRGRSATRRPPAIDDHGGEEQRPRDDPRDQRTVRSTASRRPRAPRHRRALAAHAVAPRRSSPDRSSSVPTVSTVRPDSGACAGARARRRSRRRRRCRRGSRAPPAAAGRASRCEPTTTKAIESRSPDSAARRQTSAIGIVFSSRSTALKPSSIVRAGCRRDVPDRTQAPPHDARDLRAGHDRRHRARRGRPAGRATRRS